MGVVFNLIRAEKEKGGTVWEVLQYLVNTNRLSIKKH